MTLFKKTTINCLILLTKTLNCFFWVSLEHSHALKLFSDILCIIFELEKQFEQKKTQSLFMRHFQKIYFAAILATVLSSRMQALKNLTIFEKKQFS